MTLLHIIYLIAITAEAATGALMGMRRRFDLFGLAVVGTVTALGGGSIRDMILGHYPLGWVAHPEYLLFTIGAAVCAALLARRLQSLKSAFLILDAMGLVAFTVIGCDIAATTGAHVAVVVLMGMVTGVFGGLLRDVLCNQVPLVLQRDLYATVSLATGVLYVGMLHFDVDRDLATAIAIGAGFAFRLIAIRYALGLPVFDAATHSGGEEGDPV
ncbi:trimeric intracellular cation channel family protein [Janthinobacterium sp. 17J80-10]|uniref:trimeric intracellular cation channel family protein n=1 Tax=Janthinobacterium sp. 17J80-10 TaxID=2497863 RepID=UPI0010057492|nr:trimeric intracellular cation channel family protein [Janthinobacterium sp. 17J80-10]QAU33856.1 trimeric intracellular cation channel family protein [Janthinobacterium sp. 17J80-10]